MLHTRLSRATSLGLVLVAAAAPTAAARDLRAEDAHDAVAAQDERSPDARDAADGRGAFTAPDVTVVRVSAPSPASGGLDWGDAGIGAGTALGLMLLGTGGALVVVNHRRRAPRKPRAMTTA